MMTTLNTRRFATFFLSLLLLIAFAPGLALGDDDEDSQDEDEERRADDDEEGTDEDEEADENDETDAEDDREGDSEDGDRDRERREMKLESDEEGFLLTFEQEAEDREVKVENRFQTESATYSLEMEMEDGGREVEHELKARFLALAEYQDTNGNGRYDAGEPVASAWGLGDEAHATNLALDGKAEWGIPQVDDVRFDGKPGKRVSVDATLGDQGRFGLRFLAFGQAVNLSDDVLPETGVKIDILIEDYPYVANDTALALFLETETESETEFGDDLEEAASDENGVATRPGLSDADVALVFTWKNNATVDGADRPVGTTLLRSSEKFEEEDDGMEHETRTRFVLSYPRGESILHDPESFVDFRPATAGAYSVPLPGAPLLGIVVLAVLAATRRVDSKDKRPRTRSGEPRTGADR